MYVIIRRFLEMLGLCILFSAFIGIIVYLGFLDGNMLGKTRFFTIGAAIIFTALNFIALRKSYFFVKSNVRYFVFNIIAWVLFLIVNIACYKWGNGFFYGVTFGITKALNTALFPSGNMLGNVLSAIIFHIVLVVSIILAPIGMQWVLIEAEEEAAMENEAQKIPPMTPEEAMNRFMAEYDKNSGIDRY